MESELPTGGRLVRDWYVFWYCLHNFMIVIKQIFFLTKVVEEFHVEFYSRLNHILSIKSSSPTICMISVQEFDSWSFL